MKFYKSFLVIIIISLLTFSLGEKTIVGTYASRTATNMEAISLMYLRGYYPFLEMGDNDVKLIIEKDSTFLYSVNSKGNSGRWKVNGKTLILDFTDVSRDDLELKIKNNKLYNISERTLCKSKEKMMCLLLLEKK
ncbi:hypothetical protein ACX0HA_15620 [Flavobacterium hauense]